MKIEWARSISQTLILTQIVSRLRSRRPFNIFLHFVDVIIDLARNHSFAEGFEADREHENGLRHLQGNMGWVVLIINVV